MHLIPTPTLLRRETGFFQLDARLSIVLDPGLPVTPLEGPLALADAVERVIFRRPVLTRGIAPAGPAIVIAGSGTGDAQGYDLTVTPEGIRLVGAGLPGVFYGIQTLRQLLHEHGAVLPCCTIADVPDFPVRGFYHDVTRGKVPKLETLFRLADTLAYYKLNHLELYIEHTFAFAELADVWAGADPLTAEEILRLDEYCRNRHIDLVPSLSTFGHCYHLLRSKRREHLNELDLNASEQPFSFHDRMVHYTLNSSDDEAFQLVAGMIAAFAPLFSSKFFNICCDETFDLGAGKNAAKAREVGRGRLYLDFVNRLIGVVRQQQKIPLLWGDIVAHEPGLIAEFPAGAIALNWDYGADCTWGACEPFAKYQIPYYVCPGVQGWNTFFNNLNLACDNIRAYAEQGRKHGAIGFLNTDWGDHGHVNLLFNSMHGLVYGAAASWNVAAAGDTVAFDRAFEALELGPGAAGVVAVCREIAATPVLGWAHLVNWHHWYAQGDHARARAQIVDAAAPAAIAASAQKLVVLIPALAARLGAATGDPQNVRELVLGARGSCLTHQIADAVCRRDPAYARSVADAIRFFEVDYAAAWHARNKPSEYYRIRETLLGMATVLDACEEWDMNPHGESRS